MVTEYYSAAAGVYRSEQRLDLWFVLFSSQQEEQARSSMIVGIGAPPSAETFWPLKISRSPSAMLSPCDSQAEDL
jgi:hypothetical protein